ncbi:MAG TPA: RraA family protein [Terriglobia bacterium]|nr:RraA family protein [Terriglobia bacterium]
MFGRSITYPIVFLFAIRLFILGPTLEIAGQSRVPDRQPRAKSLIPFKTYSKEEDQKILSLYDGLRVADVTDGLDIAGLQDTGLVSPEIHTLWRDVENFQHRICGLAVTVRYVPTNKRASKMSEDEYQKWEGQWYDQLSSESFMDLLRPGSVIVIDGNEDGDTGTIGSNNTLAWKLKGAAGVVTSGGARDTDEIIKEKIPLYLKRIGRGIRPGRNELESVNEPITCGGALVRPGDVIVADGDGVVVVPREQAETVAQAARRILNSDKSGRRGLYKELHMPEDKTVAP